MTGSMDERRKVVLEVDGSVTRSKIVGSEEEYARIGIIPYYA